MADAALSTESESYSLTMSMFMTSNGIAAVCHDALQEVALAE
jgi:hypothetical protein